jgi:hypothetical protein
MGNSTQFWTLNCAGNWVYPPKERKPQKPEFAADAKMPGVSMVFSTSKARGTPDAFPYAAGTGKNRFH